MSRPISLSKRTASTALLALSLTAALASRVLVAADDKAPEKAPSAPALALGPMTAFSANAPEGDAPRMSLGTPSLEPAARGGILMCNPPAPAAVVLRECCQKQASTYVGKYEFCYCAPAKLAAVCKLGPGSEQYPALKEGAWCIAMSTHPYWPAQKISCQ